MATTQELQEFADTKFPSSSELKVTPFRIFFNMVIEFLRTSIPANLNNIVSAIFGTNDISNKTIQQLVGNPNFPGTNLISYIKYKDEILTSDKLELILNNTRKEQEFFRVFTQGNTTQLYIWDEINKVFNLENAYDEGEWVES